MTGTVGYAVFYFCSALAVASFVWGVVIACSKRREKWFSAVLFGLGLPVVFGSIACAGCVANWKIDVVHRKFLNGPFPIPGR